MNKIERYLSQEYNRKYCILVGNGTTAIYLSLIAQGFENKKIAIPNNVCMNVVLPIYFSNNIPVFVDIDKETMGLDIRQVPKNQNISGIIAVHAYGNSCKINEIVEYAKKNNIFLLEDVAVAQGGEYFSKKLGSFGEISILSFGSGKNIDIEHGGAILLDDKNMYNIIKKQILKLDDFSSVKEKKIDYISKRHTELYNIDFGKSLNRYCKEFKTLCLNNKAAFLYKFEEKFYNKLEYKLLKLNQFLKKRQKQSLYLKEKLQDIEGITILESPNGSTYWRFNIFLEKYRNQLFKLLLDKQYKVSSWYHSIDLLFEERKEQVTPNSDLFGDQIINIWVNEEIDEIYLGKISDEIIAFLKGKYNNE